MVLTNINFLCKNAHFKSSENLLDLYLYGQRFLLNKNDPDENTLYLAIKGYQHKFGLDAKGYTQKLQDLGYSLDEWTQKLNYGDSYFAAINKKAHSLVFRFQTGYGLEEFCELNSSMWKKRSGAYRELELFFDMLDGFFSHSLDFEVDHTRSLSRYNSNKAEQIAKGYIEFSNLIK